VITIRKTSKVHHLIN